MMGKTNPGEVIGENLTLMSRDSMSDDERIFVWLRDMANYLIRNESLLFGDARCEEFAGLFTLPEADADMPDMLSEYVAAGRQTRMLHDKLTVCRLIAKEYESKGIDLLSKLVGGKPYNKSSKIAYFRNAYADAAFMIFSEVLENPSVIYASDFTAVCEEVYYGRADMCMLPLDSSRDAKLISFYRLIDKYELYPVMSCDVITPDGSVTTRYALFRRSRAIPEREKRDADNSCFFEFRLVPGSGTVLCDVLSAARECGLTLYKADSIPLSYSDSDFSCDVILKSGRASGLDAMVLFLTLAVPEYELLGIYPHISGKQI